MTVRYNTRIKYEASHATVTVLGVPCRGYHDDQQLLGIDETDVTLSFINTQGDILFLFSSPLDQANSRLLAAKSCADQLEDMKMELFALRLQHPQPDEVIALHLYV